MTTSNQKCTIHVVNNENEFTIIVIERTGTSLEHTPHTRRHTQTVSIMCPLNVMMIINTFCCFQRSNDKCNSFFALLFCFSFFCLFFVSITKVRRAIAYTLRSCHAISEKKMRRKTTAHCVCVSVFSHFSLSFIWLNWGFAVRCSVRCVTLITAHWNYK